MQIEYSNLEDGKPTYTYRVTRVPGQEYKVMQPVAGLSHNSRSLLNRHGIKLVFIQTGRIGRFSFTTLAIQLVTALGLLSVAVTLVEVSFCFLPQLEYFHHFSATFVLVHYALHHATTKSLRQGQDGMSPPMLQICLLISDRP